jgi:hypothetical protein
MKTKLVITIGLLFVAVILISGCTNKIAKELEIQNIGEAVPDDWNYMITTQNLEEMPRPHGLWKPAAIVNFSNPNAEFEMTINIYRNPSLLLYFYNIAEKQQINSIIEKESIYSWCIPIKFDETKKYIIVTSPCYMNGGVFTEEANKYYSPLEKSLREYFNRFK